MKPIYWALIVFALSGCSWNSNDDNTIYIPGRHWVYTASFTDTTGMVVRTNRLELAATDGFYPGPSQTEIIWTYYQTQNGDTTILRDETGVRDCAEDFFLHQPRKGDLHILSFANFPAISCRVFTDPSPYKSEGKTSMSKTYQGTRINGVTTVKEYLGKRKINIPLQHNLSVHYVKAKATSELGTIAGDFYFEEKLGFVKMDYTLPNQSKIIFELQEVDFQ